MHDDTRIFKAINIFPLQVIFPYNCQKLLENANVNVNIARLL